MKRSKHNLSHQKLLTCDMGELVPCGLMEVLPGDSIQQATSALIRCSPLLSPVMHPVDVRIHHWFVPHRLVWNDWENFITGGPDGLNASVFPTITFATGPVAGTLSDYLGVPTGVNGIEVSALPYRGYALIFNEWYRDQDLVTALTIDKTDGADTTTNTTLQNIAWEKDYFTSARPWEQKGPSISVPIGGNAPVNRVSNAPAWDLYQTGSDTKFTTLLNLITTATSRLAADNASDTQASLDPRGGLVADLSGATGASINLLREAFALARQQEARARFGSRYSEYLAYLGVRSSDARLQRPEYLGGGRNTIQFSEVLSTNGSTGGNLGQLGGHGISAMRSNRYRRFFEEHGYVFSLLSIRPKTMYIQGLRRTFNRRTKEDFWQKELEAIGQQEVKNKEVYSAHATPEGTFGYQDRYDEYRREESWINGDFRATLDTWHFGRKFASDPALNSTFVKCVPSEAPFAASSNDVMWIMLKHSVQARRLISQTGRSFLM